MAGMCSRAGTFNSIPANRPDLIRIALIFEFQNLKISGHSNFQEEKKGIFFCKTLELGH